jgi:hypothetical protein
VNNIPTLLQAVFDLNNYDQKIRSLGLLINRLRKILENNDPHTIEGYFRKYFTSNEQSVHIDSAISAVIIGI